MTIDNLAIKIARLAAPRIGIDDAEGVLDALAALGYTLETPGARPGRYIESDDQHHALADRVRQDVSISYGTASSALHAIARIGYMIREPDQHPSGLRTTEPAFTKVVGFGAKYTAAMKTIERSKYDTNGVEIDKR
jgi:hypothetical protein